MTIAGKRRIQPRVIEHLPGWLSTKQAAARLGVTPAYIDRLLALGSPQFEAPLLLLGELRLFREAAIEAYRATHPKLGQRRLTA